MYYDIDLIPGKVWEHVKRNKVAYICGSVAVLAIALQIQANSRAFTQFLEEKGIDPLEYYNPEAL